jgi:hypothetical protein
MDARAKEWILDRQISRRSLSREQRMNLIAEMRDLIEIIRQRAKERQLSTLKQNQDTVKHNLAEREEPIETRKELARLAGVKP